MLEHGDGWPTLDYEATKLAIESLHMQSQVVGKVKLALTPAAAGMADGPALADGTRPHHGPHGRSAARGVEVAFDLDRPPTWISRPRTAAPRASICRRCHCANSRRGSSVACRRLGVDVEINPMTVEVPNPVRCDEFEGCDCYDPEVAERLHAIFVRAADRPGDVPRRLLGQAVAGRPVLGHVRPVGGSVQPGAHPRRADGTDLIRRVAMDTEQFEVGFWPGNERYPRPAFFAFTFPAPAGIAEAAIAPKAARWDPDMGEFLLDYDDVIAADDPRGAILEFANSAYAAGADLAGWDRSLLDWSPPA